MLKNRSIYNVAYLSIICIAIASCMDSGRNTNLEHILIKYPTPQAQVKRDNPYNDTIISFTIDSNAIIQNPKIRIREFVYNQLRRSSDGSLKLHDIENITYWGTCKLTNHNIAVYKVKLSYGLPSIWHYFYTLLIDVENKNAYLLELDTIEPIQIQKDSNKYYFAGRKKNRLGYGKFKIFEINAGRLYVIFESEVVSNNSLDCISFKTGDLKLENIDINKDGLLDLKFSGVMNKYCNGYEQYGRHERKPVGREEIKLYYIVDTTNLTWTKYP